MSKYTEALPNASHSDESVDKKGVTLFYKG
jgi:hypothetical protein